MRKPLRSLRKFIRKIKLKVTPHRQKKQRGTPIKRSTAEALLRHGFVMEEKVPSFEPSTRYGDNTLVLLVRDSWWIYAYWEVTARREGEIAARIRREDLSRDKTVLRIYDVTGVSLLRAHSFFDIEIGGMADNWYIDVGKPDREWQAELGVRTRQGKFFMLLRSNVVRTPRFGVSDIVDEEWVAPDGLYDTTEKRLKEAVYSERPWSQYHNPYAEVPTAALVPAKP